MDNYILYLKKITVQRDKFKLKLETLDLFCPISKNAYEQSLDYLPYLLNTFKACIGCHCK